MTIDTQGFDGGFSGVVDGNGELIKAGSGLLALYGNNLYQGGTWAKDGTLAFKAVSGLGMGDLQLGDHTDLANQGTGTTSGTLRADADVDFTGTGKQIVLNEGGGNINTNGYAFTLGENTLVNGIDPSGAGREFHKSGVGTLALLNNQYYTGKTFIDNGTLQLDAVDAGAPMVNSKGLLNTPEVTIAAGARLEGQGLVGNSRNAGLGNANAIVPGSAADFTTIINYGTIAPGLDRFHNSFDNTTANFVPLTLAGNYKAMQDATVEIHTELLDDASRHGSLIIDGVVDPSSALTKVNVVHQGGSGAATDKGIEIVRLLGNLDGGNNVAQADLVKQLGDNFALSSNFTTKDGRAAVVGGAYAYVMESDIDWYGNPGDYGGLFLRNPKNPDGTDVLHPGTPLYESYTLILGTLTRLPTLEQRVGHRIWFTEQESATDSENGNGPRHAQGRGGWMRVEGSTGHYKPDLGSGRNASYDLDYFKLHVGFDGQLYENGRGSSLMAGLNFHYGYSEADVKSFHGNGDINIVEKGVGGTLTWFD